MIFQRGKGGTYWYKFQFNGVEYYRSTKTKNKKAAEDIERTLRVSLAKGEVGLIEGAVAPTLEKFKSKFFGYLSANVGSETLKAYGSWWKRLMSFERLAKAKLHTIQPGLVEEFVQFELKGGYMPGSVNHHLRLLGHALNLAEEWGIINKAPKIKVLPGERTREFVITPERYDALYAISPQQLKRMLPFLVDTGLRISEACNLKWDRVSFYPLEGMKRGYLRVDKGKSKKPRYISLTERAQKVLLEQRGISRSEYVFTGRDHIRKASKGTIGNQFRQCRDELGWPWDAVLHSTRHTALTNAGENTDVFTLMQFAGHEKVTTTQKYVHPMTSQLERIADRLEAAAAPKKVNRGRKKAGAKTGVAHIMSVQTAVNVQ